MDLISRQAAITLPVMPKEHREYQTCNLDDVYEQGWFDLQKCIENLPSAQPVIRCKDCKYRMPYDWMFSEIWRSQNINDYSEDEIGCKYCDMTMKADDFCSRAERREG